MALQAHPRSLILAPIENAYATSYWSYIFRRISEKRSHPYFAQILGCSLWIKSVMLGCSESQHPNCEIIFEEFNLCDGRPSYTSTSRTDMPAAAALRITR